MREADRVLASQQAARSAQEQQSLRDAVADETARSSDLTAQIQRLEGDLDALREEKSQILADRGALRGEVDAMKAAMADLEERKHASDARIAAYRDLLARLKGLIDAGTLEVRIVDGRMVIVLASDVLFASGSADLSSEGATTLTEVAGVLASLDRKIQVEGHTDDVPIRNDRYPSNWYLGSARAIGVVEHLVQAGVAPTQVSGATYGEHRPRAFNDVAESRARNRRIEIVVVPDLSLLPGNDELLGLQSDNTKE